MTTSLSGVLLVEDDEGVRGTGSGSAVPASRDDNGRRVAGGCSQRGCAGHARATPPI